MVKILQRFDNLLLLVAPVILLLGALIQLIVVEETNALSLLPTLDQLFADDHWVRSFWFNLSCSPLLAFLVFLYLNRFIQTDGFLLKLSNLPLFLACLGYFLISSIYQHVFIWLAVYLFILMMRYCFEIINSGSNLPLAFNSGLLLGLITLVHPMLAPFGMLFFLAMFYQGATSIRIPLAWLIGLLVPFYFGASLLYLLDEPLPQLFKNVRLDFFSFQAGNPKQWVWVMVLTVAVVVVLREQSMLNSATLKQKRKWNILFFALAISIVLSLVFANQLFAVFGLVPGAILFAWFFQAPLRARLHDFIVLLLLLSVLAAQVF